MLLSALPLKDDFGVYMYLGTLELDYWIIWKPKKQMQYKTNS